MSNISATPTQVPGGQAVCSEFLGVLRHPLLDSTTTGLYSKRQQVNALMAQTQSNVTNHVARVPVDGNSYGKAQKGKTTTPQIHECPDRISGRALQDRRRLGEDRISRGGWKPEIAELAIDYIHRVAWYDRPSKIWGVRCFVRDAENLGERCEDSKAIRAFLDRNIHKFIAFHAMNKDFQVPDYLVRKADQRRGDWVLKYPWLRSFIREYQGQARSTVDSLVQIHKDQSGTITANDRTSQATYVDQGGNSGKEMTPVSEAVGMSASRSHEDIETRPVTPNHSGESRKRQRRVDSIDDLESNDLIKRVKRESTEDEVIESRERTQEADACELGICEGNEGKAIIHAKGRNLTVLFHGMTSHGGQESEHVQVYVPRTSKGVTINFL